jgi:hypothetical protein
MAREIECFINPDGTVDIDLIGFKGQGCEKIADEIAKALGEKIKKNQKQPDYYQQEVQVQGRVRA